jgi:hypothetical protein
MATKIDWFGEGRSEEESRENFFPVFSKFSITKEHLQFDRGFLYHEG